MSKSLLENVLEDIKTLQFESRVTPSGFIEVKFSITSKAVKFIKDNELDKKYVIQQDKIRKNIFLFKSKIM